MTNVDAKTKQDLKEVIEMCKKIQFELSGSCATFDPTLEDKPLYDLLVEQGIFIKEPLEDLYMFTHEYRQLYSHSIPSPTSGPKNFVITDAHIASVKTKKE